jgi:hypothetical protein
MNEIEVGLRIDSVDGLTFFGTEEVNKLLENGFKITLVEPIGALAQQSQQEDGSVQVNITGFSIKLHLQK